MNSKQSSIINKFIILLLITFRPLLGPASCIFTISCGHFALLQLQEKPLVSALWAIIKRLLSCNPCNNKAILQ